MSSLYQIEKLDETNYVSWSMQMRSVLIHSDMWQVVSGEIKRDADPVGWDSKDQKALATIILCIKPSQLGHVKHSETSNAAWNKLKDVHQPSGPIRKVALYKNLLNLRLNENQSISSHIDSFREIIEQLASVGIQMSDELHVIIMLSSLPKEYEHFVVAIETRDELPLFEIVCIKLKEEGDRKSVVRDEHAQAFAVSTVHTKQRNNFNSTKQKMNNITCFKCGERGHIKKYCKHDNTVAKNKTEKRVMTKQCCLLGAMD